MPLLKKRKFEKATTTEYLRDNDEVFYCATTNEIFRDYEEFCERMFLCNSMVWTCSMTGKTNLTYLEALDSEENAKRSLKDFPNELKVPILYLATRTKRTAFGDTAEDVFAYSKDRYFIGESVEASFTTNKWKEARVLHVIAPPEDKNKKSPKNGSSSSDKSLHPSPTHYKYEVEHRDPEDKDICEIMIVDSTQIRRRKSQFSREKSKLFLKQHVEQDSRGIFIIKKSSYDTFHLDKVKFEKIFGGAAPTFDSSKKLEKPVVVNGKKTKQESLHKFLTKNADNKTTDANNKANKKNNLMEQMKKREEEFKLKKQQKKEEELAMKQKRKEENIVIAGHLKDWYKPKEDLELIDQKKLPIPTPVKPKVPEANFGDVLMVVEFTNTFSKLLQVKPYFPNGFTLEIAEKAFMETEVAGYFNDLIQMFLSALFGVQEEEAKQYSTAIKKYPGNVKQEDGSNKTLTYHQATQLATLASRWSKRYQGIALEQLSLCPVTTSEILRLHLLASGALINEVGAKWRYQERGGYSSEDDPGLHFRLNETHILKALAVRNVIELPIGDKLKIVSCLMDQLLTYADVRDVIDEQMDQVRQAKIDLKTAQTTEKNREKEYTQARSKLKQEKKKDPNLQSELDKLETDGDFHKRNNEYNIQVKLRESYDKQVYLGQDRAFRRFIRLESVPGLFVNFEEENPGVCLAAPVKQDPSLIDADKDATLAHIRKTLEEVNTSDKENSSPKSPQKVNGAKLALLQQEQSNSRDLLMCSAETTTCIVHSKQVDKVKWSYYHTSEDLDELINCLNKRGERESELQQTLKNLKEELVKVIEKTPVNQLNEDMEITAREEKARHRTRGSTKNKYSNLGYPLEMSSEMVLHNALVEHILEMEDKLHSGNLGNLLVKDRLIWRGHIESQNYKNFDKTITKREKSVKNGTHNNDDNEDSDEAPVFTGPYLDPGRYLESTVKTESDSEFDGQSDVFKDAVTSLRAALAQLGQAVEPKYLKKPLGHADLPKSKKKPIHDRLECWERSLLASTSFSQIFLHYTTLDSCVMWTRSILLARCRICGKVSDSENMLLCDSCNLGHHLYCLRPALSHVPSGDWFCKKCAKEKNLEDPTPEQKTPSRPRPIFRDEEIDEEEEDDEESNEEDSSLESDEGEEEEDVEEEETEMKIDLCKTCGSGGEMMSCEQCSTFYHPECAVPPLRRTPRGPWSCSQCKRKRNVEKRYYNGEAVMQRTGVINSQRRCAAKALFKIHDVAKTLRYLSDSDDDDHESDSEDDEVIGKRHNRRDDVRNDLPLHNAALQELLSEIMKDPNAWPFLRPVQKNEVPDYYEVITKPMDFGTIKYKLNMGDYSADAQLMADALLVFQNCNTYNHTEDDVYKCGVLLLKNYQKKARDLGLKLPEEMDYNNEESARPRKKKRTK